MEEWGDVYHLPEKLAKHLRPTLKIVPMKKRKQVLTKKKDLAVIDSIEFSDDDVENVEI
jgi:hypothetical protein